MRLLSEADVERLIEPASGDRRDGATPIAATRPARCPRRDGSTSDAHAQGQRAGARRAWRRRVVRDEGEHACLSGSGIAAAARGEHDAAVGRGACMPKAMIATTLFNNHRTAAGLAAAARCAGAGASAPACGVRRGQDRAGGIRYLGSVRSFERVDIVGKGSRACGGARQFDAAAAAVFRRR